MKMSQAVDGFILEKSLNTSASTMQKYRYVLDRFAGFIGDLDVDSVSSYDVRRWLLHLATQHEDGEQRRLSRRTIHDYWAVLSSFWTWAEQELSVEHAIRGRLRLVQAS